MPTHRETQELPYTTRQIFDLVADVEAYPEFLPWCIAARILQRGENEFTAELLIGYKHLREKYTSKVTLHPPAGEHEAASIMVTLIKGPFHHLTNDWQFTPILHATKVDFYLDFQFKTKLLDALIGGFFHKATQKMVAAFIERAGEIYSK